MGSLDAQPTSGLNPAYVSGGPGPLAHIPPTRPFVPHPWFRGGHAQTLICHFLPRSSRLPVPERRRFRVAPEVQVLCACHWQAQRTAVPTLLLVHGLEGSCDSNYIIGTANKAWAAGMNVVRMNVRNCGGSEKLGPTLYHSGLSEDIGEVVRTLIADDHLERIVLGGFSMGGNQVLKLAGEWGRQGVTLPEVRGIAAVCPAMDLGASSDTLHLPGNRVYEWRFLLSLRRSMRRKQRLFPGRYALNKWWWRSLRHFDDCVTAPYCGFDSAADYYDRASSGHVVDFIRVPTLIIHAEDDPFVRVTPATRAKLAANSAIRFVATEHGGHCAFLAAAQVGDPADYDHHWAEQQTVEFLVHAAEYPNRVIE